MLDGLQRNLGDLLHLGHYFCLEKGIGLLMSLLQKLLKLLETELISVFELGVIWRVFLDCVIGQVDKFVIDVGLARRVLRAAGADVALLEEKTIERGSHQDPYADVKLPAFDQQRVLEVLLDDKLTALYYSCRWLSLQGLHQRP